MIAARDLRFTYPRAGAPTLHGLTFEVKPGETFGFLGPNGAGKTTTVQLLIGILRGYGGSLEVLGREVRDHDNSLYRRIGVGFELPNVYNRLTARENLCFFRALYAGGETEEPDVLLEQVGLSQSADRRVGDFSKGMKMRLAFCRALLPRPELLFLDEPTGAQDPASSKRLREIIGELRDRGRTVFLTTHDMHVAQELCDRVAFIVDGRIELIGRPRELMLEHGSPRVRVEYRSNGRAETAYFELADIGSDPAFRQLLRDSTVEVETIHTLEATLEEIFLARTGRGLQ